MIRSEKSKAMIFSWIAGLIVLIIWIQYGMIYSPGTVLFISNVFLIPIAIIICLIIHTLGKGKIQVSYLCIMTLWAWETSLRYAIKYRIPGTLLFMLHAFILPISLICILLIATYLGKKSKGERKVE